MPDHAMGKGISDFVSYFPISVSSKLNCWVWGSHATMDGTLIVEYFVFWVLKHGCPVHLSPSSSSWCISFHAFHNKHFIREFCWHVCVFIFSDFGSFTYMWKMVQTTGSANFLEYQGWVCKRNLIFNSKDMDS